MSFHAAVGEPKLKDDVEEPTGTFGIIEPLTKIEPEKVAFPVKGNGGVEGAYEALNAVAEYEALNAVAEYEALNAVIAYEALNAVIAYEALDITPTILEAVIYDAVKALFAVPVRLPERLPVKEPLKPIAVIVPVLVKEPVKYEKLLSNSSLVSGEPFIDL